MQFPLKTFLRFVIPLLFFVFLAPLANAQFRASIQGTVTDPSGAVIPGAKLTLIDKQTNATFTTQSDANGSYNFNALPPSQFKLTAEMQGFQTRVLDNLKIIPEQPNNVNVGMQLGESSTSITVNGDQVASLDTATATISGTVNAAQIEHMPSFGRDVTQLAQLAPGVFGDSGQAAGGGTRSIPGSQIGGNSNSNGIFATENAPQIVANGGQNNMNGIQIDGISTASAVWGGSTVITPTEDSVDNVKISSNVYDAEFGRFSGAQIQITSKSGTNQIHGSLFFKGERPGLNAYQRWNGTGSEAPGSPADRGLQRDTQRFNQFGGSIGGPIWKDRLFAFFALERLDNSTVTTTTGWYETPQFLASARAGSIAARYGQYPGEAVSYNGIINSGCSQIGLADDNVNCHQVAGGLDLGSPLTTPLGTHDPSQVTGGNLPGHGNGLDGVPDIANFNLTNPSSNVATQYNGRLDANVSQKDRISFAIYWVPLTTTNYGDSVRPANLFHHTQVNNAFTALWNHTFSPTLLNEARANAAGWRWNEIDSNPQLPFGLAQINFDQLNGPYPGYNSNKLNHIGTPGGSVLNQWTYGYQDIVTKVLGRHTMKFGGSLTRLYYLNYAVYAARPSFGFTTIWDFLNDAPYSESATFDPLTGIPQPYRQDNRQNLWAGFFQDDWKVTPSLTLNLGLRYSYNASFTSKQNNLSVTQLGQGANLVSGITMRQGGDLYNPQKANFGPQIGFAYNPGYFDHKIVIRGGFGINYNQDEIAILANGFGNSPHLFGANFCDPALNPSCTGGVQYQLPSDDHSYFGYPANPAGKSPIGSNGLPTTTSVAVTGFDKDLKTITTYHYSLDTQYDFGHQWVATLGYQGSSSRHLILQYDANAIAGVNGYALNPNVSNVNMYGNFGNANYNAMLATLKHNFSHQFQAEAQYTWSKSMDNGSQPYYKDAYPYDRHLSWGRSDYNVQNAFKVFGMWSPSFFHNGLLHSLADGWTLSGIFNVHSGFPWNPVVNVNPQYCANCGYTQLRPASYNGAAGSDTSNNAFKSGPGDRIATNVNFPNGGLAYFTVPTTSATPGPAPQTPGVARNSFNGPNYRSLDASLAKAFAAPKLPIFGENMKIEFRADAFNLLNNLNLDPTKVSNEIHSANFGQVTGALGSRVIDFQARFSF